jgi:phage terminase Nu1 subunit (DNA packaging protein)
VDNRAKYKKENPFALNQTEAAAFLGMKRQSLMEYDFPTAKRGRAVFYDSRDLLAWAVERATKPYIKKLSSLSEEKNLDSERLRLTTAQADAQELKNEQARAQVVPVEFAIFALSKVANEAAGILDSLPLNIKRRYPEASKKILDAIRRELSKSMNALAALNDTALPGIIDDFINQTD